MFGPCCLEHWVKKDSEVTSSSAGRGAVRSWQATAPGLKGEVCHAFANPDVKAAKSGYDHNSKGDLDPWVSTGFLAA